MQGALNISDLMEALVANLTANEVPPLWLKICGQIGPTGTYNRKPLSAWFTDLLLRVKQLKVRVRVRVRVSLTLTLTLTLTRTRTLPPTLHAGGQP